MIQVDISNEYYNMVNINSYKQKALYKLGGLKQKCENIVKYNKAAKKEEEKYFLCGADCYFVLSYIHRKKWVDFSHKDVTSDK